MGLVKTRRRAAILLRLRLRRIGKQQRAKTEVLPMWECCQFPMLPIPNWGLKLVIGNTLSSVRCLMS